MKIARQQNEQDFENNLNNILSADQKHKYEQMKQEHKGMERHHPSSSQ